jgi:Copper type II ascorbate-dependent monooxygenase, C-terminal domain
MRIRPLRFIVFVAAAGCGSVPAQTAQQVPILIAGSGANLAPVITAGVAASNPIATAGQAAPVQMAAAAGVGAAGSNAAGSPAGAGSGGSGATAGSGSAGTGYVPSGLPDVQFTLDVTVPAGQELLECQYVAMPSDRGVIAVNSAESHYTPGSHHLLAYRTDLTALPTDHVGVWNCNDGAWFVHDKGSYYEAQQPDSHRELPPGIAHKFQPGEVVLMQAHYVNTTAADIKAHVTLALHTMEVAKVTSEAGTILFSNVNISLAPHSKSRVTMTCTVPQDFHPAELWSHMHKRASNFVASTNDAAASTALGGMLYVEPDWSEPKPRIYPFDPAITIKSGSTITFSCDFDNDTDKTITYGDSAQTNEMCIFHGMYWPRMPAAAEGCRGGMSSHMAL